MKAFLHRLRSKEKDSRESRLDKEKPADRPLEKPSPTLLPVIPPPFKQGDDFFADPALLSDRTSGPQQHNAITRALSAHNKTNNSNPPSNSTSRPQSQLDISMQKPLPPLSPMALSMLKDESSSGNRRSQEGNRSSNLSPSPVTPRVGGSRARGDPDSQGRSTLSKQSQSTSSQLNSMTTDDTSITGGSSAGATQTQNPASAAQGGTGPKKVAFISPPPTPGGLSISTALPDMVADLNSDNGGGSNPTSPPPPGHQQTSSVSKSISGPTSKDASALAESTDSTASLTLKGGATVTTPSGRSSTTNLPAKASTSKSSPSSAPGPRGVTSPTYSTRAVGTPVPHSAPARSQSRQDFAQSTVSFRSGTPYSYLSGRSTTIQPPSSWSEAAEEDLVSNLGPRERTRQEVLWEIVTSEQRYVSDLIKLKETFIDPLLHPYATSPPPFASDDPFFRAASPTESIEHLPIASRFLASPTPGQKPPGENVAGIGTVGYSRQRTASEGPRSRMQDDAGSIGSGEDEGDDKLHRLGSTGTYLGGLKGAFKDRVRLGSGNSGKSPPVTGANSPYGKSGATGSKGKISGSTRSSAAPIPSRSHQSLPPPGRNPVAQGATSSRQSLLEGSETIREGAATSMSVRTSDTKRWGSSTAVASTASKMFGNRKLSKEPPILEGSSSLMVNEGIEGLAIPTHLLPPDLRICLEVLEESLKGHMTLCEGLRKRYEEQYPLVRSLADVFIANSNILKGYATYVLHLERALEEVDNALLTPETSKKPKNQGAADWAKVCRLFKRLEEIASDKGETGLAISLSKPFQRLLKYPLMFQNLLFHTDPSTFEYEATLEMVGEVERIVRSIEDEKIQKEERDQTRDVFARIDGLEKVKLLAVPKPSRVLVEEKPIIGVDPGEAGGKQSMIMSQISTSSASGKNVRAKASFKRLSDVLGQTGGKNGVGGKHDLWLVRFNDVVLRCQRTGTTSLPLATGPANSRTSSMPDLGAGKAKYATTGRRASQLKPRNLYKFIKARMVSMEDISRSRSSGVVAIEPVKSGDTDDEDGNDSDDSDRKSKMSFSYWGADKITVDPVAAAKAQARAVAQRQSSTPGKRSSLAPTAYLRPESDSPQPAAKAKFGHRLRNSEADDDLPNSLKSSARRGISTSSASGSRRTAAASVDDTTTSVGSRKPAWNSKTSSPSAPGGVRRVRDQSITSTSSAAAARLKAASPAPTEDSGVVWIDPSVNRF
ncbi:hypothetical protein FRC04_009914 [Tulasnella sp. 424]|nr:hypothetical protein FRC04_009914 [Tulasnella sp. 424]KAG8970990.1 hypothetical protein FRC05_011565 [Tulasnella sp. 425]